VTRFAVLVALACARSAAPVPDALAAEAVAIAAVNHPALDALVARVDHLKRGLRGDLPGWQTAMRTAELANDGLGLPPFTQTVPPGPSWRPSPASLLGIEPYVRVKAPQLAAAKDVVALERMIADERKRYADGIREVSAHLDEVDAWLATPR
jgi:hypothetical protein